MQTTASPTLRHKVRRLTLVCLLVWLTVTLLPIALSRSALGWGPWPLDFWLAAQGSLLVYLLIVVVYAHLVNRWERQASDLLAEERPRQDA